MAWVQQKIYDLMFKTVGDCASHRNASGDYKKPPPKFMNMFDEWELFPVRFSSFR
jgi:hypothetical protein